MISGGAAGEVHRASSAYAPVYALLAPARTLQALPAPGDLKRLRLCWGLWPGPMDRQSPGVGVSSSAREQFLPKG